MNTHTQPIENSDPEECSTQPYPAPMSKPKRTKSLKTPRAASPCNTSYYEKLKDPRWQKKRLDVMGKAGFKCESCGDEKKTLCVHHVNYKKDTEPWDYPDSNFKCLCDRCMSPLRRS